MAQTRDRHDTVKYGSGYNLLMLEQAGAVIAINQGDGTVTIHQGGVEMGQGLITQVQQVASYVLNVPMEMIYVDGPVTSITPNANQHRRFHGHALQLRGGQADLPGFRKRLMAFGYQMLEETDPMVQRQRHRFLELRPATDGPPAGLSAAAYHWSGRR